MTIPAEQLLRSALDAYPAVIERQCVARLPELDDWYRNELPQSIARRKPVYLSLPELVRLTEWKMARGVWRAPNLVLVRGNEPAIVERITKDALARIPHPTAPISAMAKELRGVGPATASAAAAAAAPETYPFFDEIVAAQLPGLGPVAWTIKYYARYAEILRAAAGSLGRGWTPVLLERALWSHAGGKAGPAGAGA